MIRYLSYELSGRITADAPDVDNLELNSLMLSVVDPPKGVGFSHYVADGKLVSKGTTPSEYHEFNYVSKQWEDHRTLQTLKASMNDYINTSRLSANQSTFPFKGELVAVDLLSRSDIDAVHGIVVLTGGMPEGWVGGWKTVQNSFVSIPDVTTWTSFYKAMVGQGSINFAHAQSLKTRLAAAETIEEVDAIVW